MCKKIANLGFCHLDVIADLVIERVYNKNHVELLGRSRKNEVVVPRQVHMTLMSCSGLQLERAAGYFNRDHATATHSVKTIKNLLETKRPSHEYNKVVESINRFRRIYPGIDLSEMPGPWNNGGNGQHGSLEGIGSRENSLQ